jgi:Na+-transporting NADH:ubiquinone oxidoreductase subunit C
MNVDTVPRTLAVAALVAFVCAAMVASAVSILRPIQDAHKQIERNRAIVVAAGLMPDSDVSDGEIVSRYLQLEAHVVDLATGDYLVDLEASRFDHWTTAIDPALPLTRIPIYLVRKNSELQRIVLPIDGNGMWSTIYGYVALEADYRTVANVSIFHHAETPGIGDRINDPAWLEQWRGKKIYDQEGAARIDVTRDAQGVYQVDLISGASITSDAVGDMIRQLFDSDGYRLLLEQLQRRENRQ